MCDVRKLLHPAGEHSHKGPWFTYIAYNVSCFIALLPISTVLTWDSFRSQMEEQML